MTDWYMVSCGECDGPLYATKETPTVPSLVLDGFYWVHAEGWDPETLEINQVDRGHIPKVVKVPA